MRFDNTSQEYDELCTVIESNDVDEWREKTERLFGPLYCNSHAAARQKFRVVARRADANLNISMLSSPVEVERQRKHRDVHEMQSWKICYVIRGVTIVEQGHGMTTLNAGDMCVYDMDGEYSLHSPGGTSLALLIVPKETLCLPIGQVHRITGRKITGKSDITSSLATLLRSIAKDLEQFDEISLFCVNRAIRPLLSAILRENLGDDFQLTGTKVELIATVRYFISKNLADPALDPASIAAALHMSVRNLHRIFNEADTSISREIRTQRLRRFAECLRNPTLRNENIGVLASQWGIFGASKLSRQFRMEYGMSPREYREMHRS
ncbi:helix-turn-helix domain-containing protein [Nocardia vaccinii]|uniref:helix-turn-helix domain-containing protein n=1 Tax=Nocardia vaccinii TaxID=1822 RepID=UPI00082D3E57|nr:helix-turn-helix domain-containing protein [Nocardia vaccinii]